MSATEIANLQVGDLIRFNRTLRKVRRVSRHALHRSKHYFYFAILHRSWTNRPYTVYTAQDLRQNHIRLVKRGVRLRTTKMERLVQADIDDRTNKQRHITARDMAGLVT